MVFEGLALLATKEAGLFVWENVLSGLAKGMAEDYVKDFFKGTIAEGIAALNSDVLKRALGQAIGEFLKLVLGELESQDVEGSTIDHFYGPALKKFVRDARVRSVLGAPFAVDCRAIDGLELGRLWRGFQPKGCPWPEGFDWELVGKTYCRRVKAIVKTDAELGRVLGLELAEEQTAALREMAGPKVGFDLTRYRESLLEQYGALKLESLGASKYEKGDANYRSVKLWNVFVAQTAKEFESVAPQVLEIPKEQLRRMQGSGLMDEDVEAVWQRQKERYFDGSPRSVLEICGDPQIQYQVVLGDPGAGKSTLVRYLAVEWARSRSVATAVSAPDETAPIPLLIELRRYIQSKTDGECKNFLEFIHQGSNWVGNLNQGELDRILGQGRVLVMFDGLDEVVERGQRGNVLKAIHGFSQNYPQARIVVTSRVIGYRAEDLRGAGFRHFMLQDLDRGQMQRFVEDWHNITYGDAGERGRKQGRLERAIDQSKAIFELAGNPLLLTLMAILNRGEELPRDRVRLYEKAAEVLLFQWDFEEKEGLVDPRLAKYLVELDFRDKRAMLQQVAYRMQSSAEGLAGNFVTREVLQDCLVDYLRHKKDAAQAPSIAGLIIEQLRERNFILCALGGDNYAFIHRTFLEYFCATEIVERFGKRGTEGGLTFEQLRDDVFGAHWQDESWHEVLRLICGEIAPKFAGELIEFLMVQEADIFMFPKDADIFCKDKVKHLLIAADCLEEVHDRSDIILISQHLLIQLQQATEDQGYVAWAHDGAAEALLQGIAMIWGENLPLLKQWLLDCVDSHSNIMIPRTALKVMSQIYKDNPETLIWIKDRATNDDDGYVRSAAVQELARGWKDDPDTLPILKDRATNDDNGTTRSAAMRELARGWKDDPDTLPLLKDRATNDDDNDVCSAAVQELVRGWKDDPDILPLLKDRATNKDDGYVRSTAVQELARSWKGHPDVIQLLLQIAIQDTFERQHSFQDNPRKIALEALLSQAPTDPQMIELLRDRAENDNDEQLREWAEERLKGIGQ